jgi:hypothetical protein
VLTGRIANGFAGRRDRDLNSKFLPKCKPGKPIAQTERDDSRRCRVIRHVCLTGLQTMLADG